LRVSSVMFGGCHIGAPTVRARRPLLDATLPLVPLAERREGRP
jgi:hypothetical protein